MTLAKQINRRSKEKNREFDAGIKEAARLIEGAGRFRVNHDVMAEIERTQRTPLEDLLSIIRYARPPYPTTWIEWPGNSGYLGYLIQENLNGLGFSLRQYFTAPFVERTVGVPVICWFGAANVDADGWSLTDPNDIRSSKATPAGEPDPYKMAVTDVLCLLLLLNSPSNILAMEPEGDNAKDDARQRRLGRPPRPNLRSIHFNRDQIDDTAPGVHQAGNPQHVAEHTVRGHFKVRKTGLYWWSSHIRFRVTDEGTALPGDYEVVP